MDDLKIDFNVVANIQYTLLLSSNQLSETDAFIRGQTAVFPLIKYSECSQAIHRDASLFHEQQRPNYPVIDILPMLQRLIFNGLSQFKYVKQPFIVLKSILNQILICTYVETHTMEII